MVTFDGRGSTDLDGEIIKYEWAWPGGSFEGAIVEKPFIDGYYIFTLTVTDDRGATDMTRVPLHIYYDRGPFWDVDVVDYVAYLGQAECAQVGRNLVLGQEDVAASVAFQETPAPMVSSDDYLRFELPSFWIADRYVISARVTNEDNPPAPLWLRVNGSEWTLAQTNELDGYWSGSSVGAFIADYSDSNTYTLDVAFSQPGDRLDRIYFEDLDSYDNNSRRPQEMLPAANCYEPSNLPPVANIRAGRGRGPEKEKNLEIVGYPSLWRIDAEGSFDPDGRAVTPTFSIANWRGELCFQSAPEILFDYRWGDQAVSTMVFDSLRASDSDTAWVRLIRPVPDEDRTTYRLRSSCASGPIDHPLRFTIPNVSTADTGTYYLAGEFSGTEEDNCIRVRVNGGEWMSWNIFTPDFSYFPISTKLLPGTNTVEVGYCSPDLTINRIFVSPDTYYPIRGDTITGVEDVTCTTDNSPNDTLRLSGWLEAECASVGAAWYRVEDSTASSAAYLVALDESSLVTPPTDLAKNHITFIINTDEVRRATPLYVYARLDAPSPDDDSFWVRLNDGPWVAWNHGLRDQAGFHWVRFPHTLGDLRDGANHLDFAWRENGSRLDGIYYTTEDQLPVDPLSSDPACPETGGGSITLDARCGRLGSGWRPYFSELLEGTYVAYLGENNFAAPLPNDRKRTTSYDFYVQRSGIYNLFLQLNARTVGTNSVWIQVDDGGWIEMWREVDGTALLTDGFDWRKVNDNGRDVTFPLREGKHTIYLANREADTYIDKLLLSVTATPPDSLDLSLDNCIPRQQQPPSIASNLLSSINQGFSVNLYPNPTSGPLTLNLSGNYEGKVVVVLYDGLGRQLSTQTFDKPIGTWRTKIDMRQLPPGMYQLRTLASDMHTTITFFKR